MVMLRYVSPSPPGFITLTELDGTILHEGELRQCIHCQYTWSHKPGSERPYGLCLKCNGLTCGRPQCDDCYHIEKRLEDMEALERRNRASIEAAVRQQGLREQIYGYLRKKGR